MTEVAAGTPKTGVAPRAVLGGHPDDEPADRVRTRGRRPSPRRPRRGTETLGEKATDGASLAEALGGHERRDPASVQRRISPSDGVDRVLGQYDLCSRYVARRNFPHGTLVVHGNPIFISALAG